MVAPTTYFIYQVIPYPVVHHIKWIFGITDFDAGVGHRVPGNDHAYTQVKARDRIVCFSLDGKVTSPQ